MSFTNIHVTDKLMLACDEDKSSNPSQFLTVSLSPTPKVLLRGEATPESDTPCAAMEGERGKGGLPPPTPTPTPGTEAWSLQDKRAGTLVRLRLDLQLLPLSKKH